MANAIRRGRSCSSTVDAAHRAGAAMQRSSCSTHATTSPRRQTSTSLAILAVLCAAFAVAVHAQEKETTHMALDGPDTMWGHIDTAYTADAGAQSTAEWLASEAETYDIPVQNTVEPANVELEPSTGSVHEEEETEAQQASLVAEATTVDMPPRFAEVQTEAEAEAESQTSLAAYLEQPDISAEAAANPSLTAEIQKPAPQHDKTEAAHDDAELSTTQFSHSLFDEVDAHNSEHAPSADATSRASTEAAQIVSPATGQPAPVLFSQPTMDPPAPAASTNAATVEAPAAESHPSDPTGTSSSPASELPSNAVSAPSSEEPSAQGHPLDAQAAKDTEEGGGEENHDASHAMRLRRIYSSTDASALQPHEHEQPTDNVAEMQLGGGELARGFSNLDKELNALQRESDRDEVDGEDSAKNDEGLGAAISEYLQDSADPEGNTVD